MAGAQRGDLIAVRHNLLYGHRVNVDSVEIGTITSVSRSGIAKAWAPCWTSTTRKLEPNRGDTWRIIQAQLVHTDDLLDAVRRHVWPGQPAGTLPQPFDSFAEAREFVLPYIIRTRILEKL